MLATNFGSLFPKVTNFGSQKFGYQIWFCTRLLRSAPKSQGLKVDTLLCHIHTVDMMSHKRCFTRIWCPRNVFCHLSWCIQCCIPSSFLVNYTCDHVINITILLALQHWSGRTSLGALRTIRCKPGVPAGPLAADGCFTKQQPALFPHWSCGQEQPEHHGPPLRPLQNATV